MYIFPKANNLKMVDIIIYPPYLKDKNMTNGLRSIITEEIQDYIIKAAEGTTDNNIIPFINNLDPFLLELFDKVTRIMTERARKEFLGTINTTMNENFETTMYIALKRIAISACIVGWLTEHLSRNNLELNKAPSIKKYLSSIGKSEGDIDTMLQNLKASKIEASENSDFQLFMQNIDAV